MMSPRTMRNVKYEPRVPLAFGSPNLSSPACEEKKVRSWRAWRATNGEGKLG